MLLILAANTAFADFPRLASLMARDRFLPNQFAFRGDRLAFTTGIVFLAAVAAVLVVVFGGSVTNLIPLYTVGVFVAFTLSQAGMVRHHRRLREPGWRQGIAINALGALATGVVAVVVGVTKFALGAWMVLVLIPLLVLLLLSIRRHYHLARDQLVVTDEDLRTRPDLDPHQLRHVFVIPVADLNRAAVRAVAYARSATAQVDQDDVGASGESPGRTWWPSTSPTTWRRASASRSAGTAPGWASTWWWWSCPTGPWWGPCWPTSTPWSASSRR